MLATELGLSRRSLRHALDILEAEERITRHQGRGTFVIDGRPGTESLVRELAKLNTAVRQQLIEHAFPRAQVAE